MNVISQAQFARLYGVSRITVTKWKTCDWPVLSGKKVDIESSNARLAMYQR